MFSLFQRPKPQVLKPASPKPELIEYEGLSLKFRVNKRSKRLSLRIDAKSGEVILSAPRKKDLPKALEFALSRRDWIEEKQVKRPEIAAYHPDQVLCLYGLEMRLQQSLDKRAARLVHNNDAAYLVAGGEGADYSRRIARYIRSYTLKIADGRMAYFAEKLGYDGVKLSLFDAKGRWGSCTPARKTIRLSWRLILAPAEVFDYVCAHEVAHLRHPDHSAAFWAEVERLFGDYRPARAWLKAHGQSLFHYAAI